MLPLRMFSPSNRRKYRITRSITPPPAGKRKTSQVAHEKADFSVKVHSWQKKINDEEGTDYEVNLNKARKTSDQSGGPVEKRDMVRLRRRKRTLTGDETGFFSPSSRSEMGTMRDQSEAKKLPRPISSFGVTTSCYPFGVAPRSLCRVYQPNLPLQR